MKIGLRKILHDKIKSKNGEIFTHRELEQVCDEYHYRRSNAERRLRPSDSPEVITIYNKKEHIIGYVWRVSNVQQEELFAR